MKYVLDKRDKQLWHNGNWIEKSYSYSNGKFTGCKFGITCKQNEGEVVDLLKDNSNDMIIVGEDYYDFFYNGHKKEWLRDKIKQIQEHDPELLIELLLESDGLEELIGSQLFGEDELQC